LAQLKNAKDAEVLYQEAFEKFKKAIEIKPDYHEAFNNWGNGLGNLAQLKNAKDAEVLYQEAFEKYKIAIEIKPDYHQAFYNWGTYLGNLAQLKDGKDAEYLYAQAVEKYQKAIEYGGHSYNLSCLYALRGEKDNALKYLDISLAKHEVSVAFVEADEDFKAFYEDTDFKALLSKHKKPNT
jgi:tetratricopeptide (TPR) repeat protein